MQDLNQGRARQINPQVKLGLTTTVLNRQETPKAIQNHQEQYTTCQKNAKAASDILNLEDSSTNGHNQLAASK